MTADFAESWSNPVEVSGAVDLAVTAMGYVVATVGSPECAGVQLIALSTEPLAGTPTGCFLVDSPVETMQGNVAVSEASGTFWLWIGNEVKRSSDGGVVWQ